MFAGFVARMGDTRLPKRVMFEDLVGDVGCVGGQEKSGWGVSWTTSEARAGLRHAVVCPNVTGMTKERIAQSKRARAGSLALVD